MKLHELRPTKGTNRPTKRLGRGTGSGQGKTAGKGHKGQNARSGGGVRPGFAGGQLSLIKRIPKRGFTNVFAKEYAIVNIEELEIFDNGAEVNAETLKAMGIIKKELDGVKILGNGDLSKKLTVKAKKFSATASSKIEAAGGKAEVI